jgi:hypothetical protein
MGIWLTHWDRHRPPWSRTPICRFATRMEAVEATQRHVDQNDIDIAVGVISSSLGVVIGTAQERLRQAAARAGITDCQGARAVRALQAP